MYTSLGQREDFNQLAGAHARPDAADFHIGSRQDFLRRHERAATEAIQRGRPGIEEIAPYLLRRVADARNLRIAWDYLRRRGGAAPGPNGHRYSDLEEDEVWELMRAIGYAIRQGTYRPGLDRLLAIPKGNDRGTRTLKLQNIEDRVVARAVVQIIQPLLDLLMDDRSYGYRPGRDRRHALAEALVVADGRDLKVWVVEDIKDAFDKVPLNRLLDVLRLRLPDDVVRLIETATNTGSKRGIRQGSPLSPLLLNLYLDHFLDKVWARWNPDVPLLRTADDLLILCRTEEQAHSCHRSLQQILTPAGMPLKGTPTTTTRNLSAGQQAEWLGFEIGLQGSQALVCLAGQTWFKLADELALAHARPGSPLRVIPTILGWADQIGPCYADEDRDQVYARVASAAKESAFEEFPTREQFFERWSRAHARWLELRTAVGERGGRHIGGSAGHLFFEANAGRGDGALSGAPSPFSSASKITIYTDGSCLPGQKIGGWAYLIFGDGDDQPAARRGGIRSTTNNRAELIAAIKALQNTPPGSVVLLATDSEYVAAGIGGRLGRWKAQGWRAGSSRHKRPLLNLDLWRHLDELLCLRRVTCRWLRAHTGQRQNERCDEMARFAAEKLARRLAGAR